MVHTGQCLCGQVRFTIDAEPEGARMCWCRDCQRIASGSATVNVLFPEKAVRFSGEITTIIKTADSGNTVTPELVNAILAEETERLRGEVGEEAFAKFYEPASRLIADICVSDEYTDFLTLPAYELVS